MKELDRKDAPGVTGGTVGPYAPPIIIDKPVLPAPGPDFPPNPISPDPPVIEHYNT
jgi:hypothetical protein